MKSFKLRISNLKIVVMAIFLALLITPSAVYAHVSVKPNQAGIASFQTFSVGVPVEKDIPTIGVRVIIPEGVEHVSPNVKPGWTISVKHADVPSPSAAHTDDEDSHAEGPVTEISWTGGSIPAGQRDDFLFSAKVPGSETTLKWKAYQTYADGSVVSWDLDKSAQPKDSAGKDDFSKSGSYSETKVINDLKSPTAQVPEQTSDKSNLPLMISVLALALAGTSLWKTYSDKRS